MGSSDALEAAFRMRDSMRGKDGFFPSVDLTTDYAAKGLEGLVQPQLSGLTKLRFRDVQKRSGFYARRGRK
jgi:hypothetical protein